MNEQICFQKKGHNNESVTVKLKENERPILDGKLELNGLEYFNHFISAWIKVNI